MLVYIIYIFIIIWVMKFRILVSIIVRERNVVLSKIGNILVYVIKKFRNKWVGFGLFI